MCPSPVPSPFPPTSSSSSSRLGVLHYIFPVILSFFPLRCVSLPRHCSVSLSPRSGPLQAKRHRCEHRGKDDLVEAVCVCVCRWQISTPPPLRPPFPCQSFACYDDDDSIIKYRNTFHAARAFRFLLLLMIPLLLLLLCWLVPFGCCCAVCRYRARVNGWV